MRIQALTVVLLIGASFVESSTAADKKKPLTKEAFLKAFEERIQKNMANQQKSMELGMRMRIREIGRVCQLTEDQSKRLSVAAKGATERFIQSQGNNDQMRQFADAIWRDLGQIQQLPQNVGIDFDDFIPVQEFGFAGSVPQVYNQPLWKKSLARTLSKEQLGQLKTFDEQRKQRQREATVTYAITKLDKTYFLTDEQQGKLKKLLPPLLDKHLPNWAELDDTYQLEYGVYQVPPATFASVLDEQQLKHWTQQAKQYQDGNGAVGVDSGVGIEGGLIQDGVIELP